MLLHAMEYKTFFPLGSDKPVSSRFQLLCGTNRDLWQGVTDGTFREDLLARINLWTFTLPGLAERPEDLEPNVDYELGRYTEEKNVPLSLNVNARRRFLEFGTSAEALWLGNFRDLNAAIVRIGTLCEGGRKLFSVSLAERSSKNNSDRLRKYLQRFGLKWEDIS